MTEPEAATDKTPQQQTVEANTQLTAQLELITNQLRQAIGEYQSTSSELANLRNSYVAVVQREGRLQALSNELQQKLSATTSERDIAKEQAASKTALECPWCGKDKTAANPPEEKPPEKPAGTTVQ